MKRLSFPGELGQGREPLWWMIGLALSLSAITGCEKDQPMDSPKGDDVSGTGTEASLNVEVFYRERMMLPPTATLEVVLEDSAKMDVAADRIANKTISVESGPPYRVTLAYDPSKLDPKGRFGVRARIEDQGKLIFISMEFVPAFGNDGSLGAPANDPVTVLVRRTRGSTEKSSTSVTGTRWSLQTLRGEPAGLGAGGQTANITLQGAEPLVSGFAGCNQLSGGYELDGDQLSFGQLAMTMRACTEGGELERDFAKALGDTRGYEVTGDILRLSDASGAVIAELKAD